MKIKEFLQTYINRFRQVRQNQRDLKIANQHVDLHNVETSDMLEYVDSAGTVDPSDREKLSDFFRNSPLAHGEFDLSRDKSLPVLMEQISDNALERGLTTEILDDLLNED